jgi:hypothetical protein
VDLLAPVVRAHRICAPVSVFSGRRHRVDGGLHGGASGFTIYQARRKQWLALVLLAWYFITLGPVVPLRDHITDYYLTLPAMCLAMLGGYALACAWRAGMAWKDAERGPGRRLCGATRAGGAAHRRVVSRARRGAGGAGDGSARAHELHPGKVILLDGVDDDLFWGAIEQRPFLFLRIPDVYLTPGSEARISPHPEWTTCPSSSCPPTKPAAGWTGTRLWYTAPGTGRCATSRINMYRPPARRPLPGRCVSTWRSAGADRLGPGWYPLESGFRWMPRTASVRMPGPRTAGQKLYVTAICPAAQVKKRAAGDDGDRGRRPPGSRAVYEGQCGKHIRIRAAPEAAGKSEIDITVEVSRTVRVGADRRDLGLAFGRFEIK